MCNGISIRLKRCGQKQGYLQQRKTVFQKALSFIAIIRSNSTMDKSWLDAFAFIAVF